MRILVTGGAGFIGSHIADAFLERGARVDIVDNLSTGYEPNIPAEAGFYHLNIDDPEVAKIVRGGYDVLCHHAAQVDLRRSLADPVGDLKRDVAGSAQLFHWAVESGIEQILFASSVAVYGEQDYFPADELHPVKPVAPYGLYKRVIEQYLEYLYRISRTLYCAFRYANVYGPRQHRLSEAGVISIFATRLLTGEKAVINGSGEQTRDFVYVSDVVAANIAAIERRFCGIANIATEHETSVKTVFRMLRKITGAQQPEKHGPPVAGDQARSLLSYRKARDELDWSPRVSLKDGLTRTVESIKKVVSHEPWLKL